MEKEKIINLLKAQKNEENLSGMSTFGINTANALGISVVNLRKLAKEIKESGVKGQDLHTLAKGLWESEIHEARILAILIDLPELVDQKQANAWVFDLDSWDVCDQFCSNLIDKTPFAFEIAHKWAEREEEFVRRASFSLMATLAVHRKEVADEEFEKFFPLIMKYSTDDRNFVKKSVNWALRQIGKRSKTLRKRAIFTAEKIEQFDSKPARWVAKDALRELRKQDDKAGN